MRPLVFLEHDGAAIGAGGLGVLARAAELAPGAATAVLVGGPDVRHLAAEAGRRGAARVVVAADESLAAPLPQLRVEVLAGLVTSGAYDTVLLSNSVLAADVAAGLAVRLEAGLNWDLVALDERDGSLVGTRLALGDSVQAEVGWRSDVRVALFRAGSFDPLPADAGAGAVVDEVAGPSAVPSATITVIEHIHSRDEGPPLEDADVVVSGGMGLGGKEHFALAEQLADALGGVVGATRAAVYAGWYPHSAQVGQTGKTVCPRLYIALGVSGAVQHKVGMQSSKTIVAINTDPAAPIFEFSDLAVVGDVHAIVPPLVELLRQRRGS
jgi:electron transfer flavoprotein alpha subunit